MHALGHARHGSRTACARGGIGDRRAARRRQRASRPWWPPPRRIAVVYPHMNSIGGDAFWLIHVPGETPRGIDACGAAGCQRRRATFYRDTAPRPDTVSRRDGGQHGRGHVVRMVARARATARICSAGGFRSRACSPMRFTMRGMASRSRAASTTPRRRSSTACSSQPGFDETFLHDGDVPRIGAPFYQPRLAATLQQLATAGLDDFYRGDLARSIVARPRRVRQPA